MLKRWDREFESHTGYGYMCVCVLFCWYKLRVGTMPHQSSFFHIWLYSPLLDLGRFFSFLIFYTVGRTPYAGDQHIARPLLIHRINAHRHPCFKWDLNPRSQCLSGRRQFIPYTARPLWSAPHPSSPTKCLSRYTIRIMEEVSMKDMV
jgi:hypothetical protein